MPDLNGSYTAEDAKQLLDEVKLVMLDLFGRDAETNSKISVLLSRDQIEIEIRSRRLE